MPNIDVACRKSLAFRIAVAGFCLWMAGVVGTLDSVSAAGPKIKRPNPLEATSSEQAKQEAIQSIPLERLSSEDRADVQSVLSEVSLFRRLPVGVVDCDPSLYLFLVRHPDVVVNIWDVLDLSKIQLRQIDEERFQLTEPAGTTATLRFLYQSHDTHVIYGEGTYQGPLLSRPVQGRAVMVLKSGYVLETNGRHYITNRLDCFLTVAPAGAEVLTKLMSPWMGKTVDNNFIQTVSFVGSLSRTAEVNQHGVLRLASQLKEVRPEVRVRFVALAADLGERSSLSDGHSETAKTQTADKPSVLPKR